jgi:hypothetical protein
MLTGAGFIRMRRATEGPFNMVLETRPKARLPAGCRIARRAL